MGRKPIRLERALYALSACADAQKFIKDPCVILQSQGMIDGSVLIKKLAAINKVEIRDTSDGGRITLIKILPSPENQESQNNSACQSAVVADFHKNSTEVKDDAKPNLTPSLPKTAITASDNWKNTTYCHAKLFALLKETAKTAGTYPNIEEPMLILQKHGFKQPSISQYLKRLRLLGCVEVIGGEGKNGRGIAKIVITKENLPIAAVAAPIKDTAPDDKEKVQVDALNQSDENTLTAPPRKNYKNRVMAFLDLENLFLTLEKKGLTLDALKLKNVCDNYGSYVQLFSLVSVGTYQRAESAMEKIIAQGMPITLVRNGKDSVDAFIMQLVEKALQNDLADTFIIGTHDEGFFYQETIKKIKTHNKVFKLLTVDVGLAKNLRAESNNGCINAAPKDNREHEFKDCVRRLTHNHVLETNTAAGQLVKEVISVIYRKVPSNFSFRFFQLTDIAWNNLDYKTRAQFRQVDCEYAISALHNIAQIIKHESKKGRNGKQVEFLYMDKKHPLLAKVLC